jgi:hypothetical protein
MVHANIHRLQLDRDTNDAMSTQCIYILMYVITVLTKTNRTNIHRIHLAETKHIVFAIFVSRCRFRHNQVEASKLAGWKPRMVQ